jgi:hypothetical protein
MMKFIRTFAVGAAACVAFATPVKAFTESEQKRAVERVATVMIATTDDRCPRFKAIDAALVAEGASYGITDRAEVMRLINQIDADLDQGHEGYGLYVMLISAYKADPGWCERVWREFGPDGTYKRQLIEAKTAGWSLGSLLGGRR